MPCCVWLRNGLVTSLNTRLYMCKKLTRMRARYCRPVPISTWATVVTRPVVRILMITGILCTRKKLMARRRVRNTAPVLMTIVIVRLNRNVNVKVIAGPIRRTCCLFTSSLIVPPLVTMSPRVIVSTNRVVSPTRNVRVTRRACARLLTTSVNCGPPMSALRALSLTRMRAWWPEDLTPLILYRWHRLRPSSENRRRKLNLSNLRYKRHVTRR